MFHEQALWKREEGPYKSLQRLPHQVKCGVLRGHISQTLWPVIGPAKLGWQWRLSWDLEGNIWIQEKKSSIQFLWLCVTEEQRRGMKRRGWERRRGGGNFKKERGETLTACWGCPIQRRPRWCPLLCPRCRYGPAPCGERRKEGDKKDWRRGGRGAAEQGQGLPALKRYTALAEDGLEVTGYPFAHTPSLSPFLPTSSSPPCTWP